MIVDYTVHTSMSKPAERAGVFPLAGASVRALHLQRSLKASVAQTKVCSLETQVDVL